MPISTPPKFKMAHEKGWLEDNFPFGMNLRGYVKFSGCIASLPARNNPEINNFPQNKNQRNISHRQFAHSFFWDHLNLHQRWKLGSSKHPSKIEQTLKKETCHSYRKWSLNTVNFRSITHQHWWCWTVTHQQNPTITPTSVEALVPVVQKQSPPATGPISRGVRKFLFWYTLLAYSQTYFGP